MSRGPAILLLLSLLAAPTLAGDVNPDRIEVHRRFLASEEVQGLPPAQRSRVICRYLAAQLEGLGYGGLDGGRLVRTTEVRRFVLRDPDFLAVDEVLDLQPGRDYALWTHSGEGEVQDVAPGNVLLLLSGDLSAEEIRSRLLKAAADGAVGALLGRRTWDEVRFRDGRTERGRVVDGGEVFHFVPEAGTAARTLTKDELREILFGAGGGLLPALLLAEEPSWRAPFPVVRITGELTERLLKEPRAAALTVVRVWSEKSMRSVAARRSGAAGAGGDAVLVAPALDADGAAAALAVAEALAAGATPPRGVVVVFGGPGEAGLPSTGRTVRILEGGRSAAERALAELRAALAGETAVKAAVPATYESAVLARAAGDLTAARRRIEAAIAKTPDDLRLHLERGRIAIAAGTAPAAELEHLKRADPEGGRADMLRAEIAFAAGNEVGGLKALDRAADAGLAEALIRRAYLRGGSPEGEADLRDALGRGSGTAVGWCARGVLLMRDGRNESALKLLGRAIEADPALAPALVWRASLLVDLDQDQERALEDLDRALGLGLLEPGITFSRGLVLLRLARYPEAIAVFLAYLERGTERATALYNVACGHAMQGHTEEALEWLGRAVEAGFASRAETAHARVDPDLESIRGDPRFERILRSVETE